MLIKIFYYYFINHVSFKRARGARRMSRKRFPLVDGRDQINCKLKITRIKLSIIEMYGSNYFSPLL